VDPIKVDALLLRTLLPDLALREGARMVGRVAARAESGGLGTLVLAGVRLTAQLPDEVAAGDTLRLTVTEAGPDRITLRMDAAEAAQAPPLPVERPPERARVSVREAPRREGEDPEGASVVLVFESSVLGRLDLQVELGRGAVSAHVATPAGPVTDLAREQAAALRDALAAELGRSSSVTVTPRRDPVDLYA
jgi:hypothetical protein